MALKYGNGQVHTVIIEINPLASLRDQPFLKTLRLPANCDGDYLDGLGMIEQMPDILYVTRDVNGTLNAEDDVFFSYVESPSVVQQRHPEIVEKVNKVSWEMLGEREGRDGGRKGGIFLEEVRLLCFFHLFS